MNLPSEPRKRLFVFAKLNDEMVKSLAGDGSERGS